MAGRIPDSFIHDLLARTDIVELIGSRVELKRAGKELRGLSPFTSEKSPSFFVSPLKQMFFDFSSGQNGNAIGFLMAYDRLSFVEAVEELAHRAGVEVPREGGAATHVVMDGPLDALAAAQRHYVDNLRQHAEAVDYLKRRGVSGETARRYGIGYALDSWDDLTRFLKDARHALDAGLLIERDSGGVYDRFRNRIMFPIRDNRGRVIGFGGRTLGNDPAKYLNSPETPLFHKGRNLYGLYEARQAASKALPHLIVVEGYMDVVMLAQHGIDEAVATLGTATTREHLQVIFKATGKVVFCFDGDRAGRAAAWRALEQALPELHGGRECVFMFLPEGHDPDTLVQEIGAEAFRERIGQAQPLSQFLLGELARQVNLGTMEGRARLVALAQPHLAKLRDGPLKALMLDELSRMARIGRDDIAAGAVPAQPAAPAPDMSTGAPAPLAGRPVRRILRLLLEQPALAERVGNHALLLQSGVPGIEVFLEVVDYFQADPDASVGQLLAAWQALPNGRIVERLAAEQLPPLSDADVAREFADTLESLNLRALEIEATRLLAESRQRDLSPSELAIIRDFHGRRPPRSRR